jgi:hypothetical protein
VISIRSKSSKTSASDVKVDFFIGDAQQVFQTAKTDITTPLAWQARDVSSNLIILSTGLRESLKGINNLSLSIVL